MSPLESTVLEVSRAAPLRESRTVTEPLAEPGDGQLVLQVERFGLSSNNISYALLGNEFGSGYWRPFPAEDGWGRVPAWGVARVLDGDPALADVGERFVGFVPMADRMLLHATRTDVGLRDISTHREGMLPLYRDMRRVSTDPTWREDLLDVHVLLRSAYPPAALLADELGHDGTPTVLMTGATSMTALLTARLLTARGLSTTGLTSPARLDAAVATGAYTRVLTYPDISSSLPLEPAVLLDVAGNPGTTRAIHARLGEHLARDIFIGGSDHNAAAALLDSSVPRQTPEPERFNTGVREVELARDRGDADLLRLQDAARDTLVPWAAG